MGCDIHKFVTWKIDINIQVGRHMAPVTSGNLGCYGNQISQLVLVVGMLGMPPSCSIQTPT